MSDSALNLSVLSREWISDVLRSGNVERTWIYENLCVLCEAAHKNVTNLTGRSQVKQFYGVKE